MKKGSFTIQTPSFKTKLVKVISYLTTYSWSPSKIRTKKLIYQHANRRPSCRRENWSQGVDVLSYLI